jgi:hypothetical protein
LGRGGVALVSQLFYLPSLPNARGEAGSTLNTNALVAFGLFKEFFLGDETKATLGTVGSRGRKKGLLHPGRGRRGYFALVI